MDCGAVRDWLLHADRPGDFDAAPAVVAAHARDCAACTAFAEKLVLVEANYRAEPVPAAERDARDPLYPDTTLIYPNLGTPITRSKRGSLVFFYTARAGTRPLTGRVELATFSWTLNSPWSQRVCV